jgi:hypothetical protein
VTSCGPIPVRTMLIVDADLPIACLNGKDRDQIG